MSTFFSQSAPPRTEDHPANRAGSSGSDGNAKDQSSSKYSAEKESTLPGDPAAAPAATNDTSKEAAGDDSPATASNENSNKESESSGGSKEAAQDGEQSGSDDSDAEKKEDNTEYPSGWRLLLITIALCLCVFCTALVRCLSNYPITLADISPRTTRLSQRPSPRSLMSLTPSPMLVGMAVHTY